MKSLVLFGVLGALSPLAHAQNTPEKPGAKPNVLFLAVDDLNDWVGALGVRADTKTPNIDRLAARGVNFSRAYCSSPSCNPSRASLLTGVRPSNSGVYDNNQDWRPVLKDRVTLPQNFRNAGYEVIGAGKIFHNSFNDRSSFDQFYGPQEPPRPEKPRSALNSSKFDFGPVEGGDEVMGDTQVVGWAIEKMREPRQKPLFLGVGLIRPHLPFYAPKKYFDLHPIDQIKLPPFLEDDLKDVPPVGVGLALKSGDHQKITKAGQWRAAVQAYLACISYADAQIGRLLDALDATPQGRKTIIVLWGDHGWNLGEKEHWRKFALWERTTHVPLLFVAPGVTKPYQTSTRTVNLMDIYPTLNELCGLPIKPEIEGTSLVPLLQNPQLEWNRPSVSTYLRGNHAVRSEDFRYIRYHDGGEELYNARNDPNEWTNVAGDPKFAEVKRNLARWLPKVDAPDAPLDDKSARKGQEKNGGKVGKKGKKKDKQSNNDDD